MIEWENGEITSESLAVIGVDDPVTYIIYANECNLLDKLAKNGLQDCLSKKKSFFSCEIRQNCVPFMMHQDSGAAMNYLGTMIMSML